MRPFLKILLLTALLAVGCGQNKSSERQRTYDELSSFVDRLESQLLYRNKPNWPSIERQYKRLENNAEEAWRKAKGGERKALDELEIRYETIEANEKLKVKLLIDEARFHMNNLEIWYNLKASDSDDQVKQQIAETGARQSIQWFKENYHKLEFRTKKRFDDNLSRWEFEF